MSDQHVAVCKLCGAECWMPNDGRQLCAPCRPVADLRAAIEAETVAEILAIVRAKEVEYAKHQCFIHEDGDGPPLCDGCGMENAAWEIADAIERWRAKP